MPTFTTYREASKDEMGREIDRCHKVIAELEARAEAAEAERDRWHRIAMAAGVITCSDGGLIYSHEDRAKKAEARIAELEARLARVPSREAMARVVDAAARLVSFIDNEGPPAREWEAISETTGELAVAIAAMQDTAQLACVPDRADGSQPLPYDRDTLGRFVREAWVRWAKTQPDPKPSWLAPYDDLSEPDKEADRQIGEAVARWTLIGDAASSAQLARVPSREEVARAIHDAQWPGIRLRKEHREKYLAYADAVLALFAKQETKP